LDPLAFELLVAVWSAADGAVLDEVDDCGDELWAKATENASSRIVVRSTAFFIMQLL
jgi:hypothetical protein